MTRRRFLGRAAGAAAAAWLVPSRVFGANERIGVGFIGMGQRGGSHLNALLGYRDVRATAVCDPIQKKRDATKARAERRYAADTAAGTYAGCGSYADFRELLARDDVDVVVIASPEYWHALHTVHAVKAGKDVYCEKAMTLTHAEGRAVVDAVRRYRRVFQLGTQQRSGGNFRLACELARNGYLGRIKRVEVGVPGGKGLPNVPPSPVPPGLDYEMWLGPAPFTPYNKLKCSFNWYFMYDYCIGWIGSWGVHHVDIAHWGCPDLGRGRIEVEGTSSIPPDGLGNTATSWRVEFTTPRGVVFSFSDNRHHKQGCRFIGDEGSVHVNRGGIRADPQSLLKTALKPDDERLYVSGNHHGNFLECVRTRRDPVSNVEAGHVATTLTIIADIAARAGRRLTWDWDAERFVGDEGANRFLRRPMRSPWSL
jgi:predicted dehydrogenase